MRFPALVLSLVFMVHSASAQDSSRSSLEQVQQCTISGRVVRADSGRPLKRAQVMLTEDDGVTTATSISDEEGNFFLSGINPGRVVVTASRRGFLAGDDQGSGGIVLTLAPGQRIDDLVFRMKSSGAITGRVVNEDGEGVQGAEVYALRPTYWGGRKAVSVAGSTRTDDRGEYRVYGLAPGRYYIRVSADLDSYTDSRSDWVFIRTHGFSRGPSNVVFYPGTTELEKASQISVAADSEASRVDFSLGPARTYSIRGRLVGLPRGAENCSVEIRPRDLADGLAQSANAGGEEHVFAIDHVPTGAYVISATAQVDQISLTAVQDLYVGDSDVSDETLAMSLGVKIDGRVRWEGQSRAVAEAEVTLLDETGRIDDDQNEQTNSEGTFEFTNVVPGTYSIGAKAECTDCFLKSVKVGGTEMLGRKVVVPAGGEFPLVEITYRAGARVRLKEL
jgi:Carboxypeptidase regulatory-like domain